MKTMKVMTGNRWPETCGRQRKKMTQRLAEVGQEKSCERGRGYDGVGQVAWLPVSGLGASGVQRFGTNGSGNMSKKIFGVLRALAVSGIVCGAQAASGNTGGSRASVASGAARTSTQKSAERNRSEDRSLQPRAAETGAAGAPTIGERSQAPTAAENGGDANAARILQPVLGREAGEAVAGN